MSLLCSVSSKITAKTLYFLIIKETRKGQENNLTKTNCKNLSYNFHSREICQIQNLNYFQKPITKI